LAWEYNWFGMQQIDCHSADMSTATVTADDSDDDETDAYNRIHDAETTSGYAYKFGTGFFSVILLCLCRTRTQLLFPVTAWKR
jgi:hypothetical protein